MFFFFSSRRRHTRFDCDWSSDVCSSDLVAELIDGSGRTDCDAIGLHSQYWAERTPDCLRIRAYARSAATGEPAVPVDDAAVVATLGRLGRIVGIPELDQCHWIDPLDVRRRLGLDPAQPVVLYCPFPFRSNPRTFWVP